MAQAQAKATAEQAGPGGELAYGVTHDAAAYPPDQRWISPMPVGSGEALPDGVADGDTGALATAAGVGTGGSVSEGRGSGSNGDPVEAPGRTATGVCADADRPDDAREPRDG